MESVQNDSLRGKIDLLRHARLEKIVARYQEISLVIVLATGFMCGCETRQIQSPQQSASRKQADEVFGIAAVEAASAGDYDAADDLLNYVESDAICDDYSEVTALKLLALGKDDEATAIAYKIEGLSRRDRLLKQIEDEMPCGAKEAETDREIHKDDTTTEPIGW